MIPRHSTTTVDQMRPVGAFVARVLRTLEEKAQPGVSLLDLDALAHDMIREVGATSCYIDYHRSFGGVSFLARCCAPPSTRLPCMGCLTTMHW